MLGTSLLITGCGDAPEQSSGAENNEYGNSIEAADDFYPDAHFDWAYPEALSSWDPIESPSGNNIIFYKPVYDRLLHEGIDGDVTPMLATEYTASEDGKTLTLQLREGLAFSDGEPFNADAVKFNLDRARGEGSTLSGELTQVTSVDVVDEYTVELKLSGQIGPIPVTLSSRAGIMVSPAAAKSGTLATQPVGIGPYSVTQYVPGDKAEYEKTPDYWDPDAQRVASMTYYAMPDDQTRLNALKSGEIDAARVNADQMDGLATDNFTPLVQPSARYLYFMVNASQEPFDNPEVRKALNMAIDREAISQGLYDGYCTPQIHPFPETGPGYSKTIGDGLEEFPYDPEAAKKALEDAGVADLQISTTTSNITSNTKLAEAIQEQLSGVGIDMTIKPVPTAEMVQAFVVDQSVEAITSIATGINDPDVSNARYVKPDAYLNAGGTEYPDLNTYGDEGAASLNPRDRAPFYEKYLESWIETPPHLIPICMSHEASAYAPNVSGVSQRTNGYSDLRGVSIAQE
ncbi:ABC transporter substrate-binding protein [Cumulibacter soli]|uniref:ABC transporter substrate-binding protein n=1 Tax=Cumulibacter soli TaxID=2546344 RepID=UPI00106839BC|nr:ABC transporter substrate-binding protein [Cumulibacter soli]